MIRTFRIHYLRPSARALYEAEGGLAYATPHSAGLDLRACPYAEEQGGMWDANAGIIVPAGGRVKVPTGIALEPPAPDVAGFVYSRSGLGAVQGLVVAQGTGVIDPDYRGEIIVYILNTSGEERRLRRGERIAQLVFQPIIRARVELTDTLGETERGAGAFGHTGKI